MISNSLKLPKKVSYYQKAYDYKIDWQRKAMKALLKNNKTMNNNQDTFETSNNKNTQEVTLYTSKSANCNVSDKEMADAINFGKATRDGHDNSYYYKGRRVESDSIPQISADQCESIKAENNVIDIKTNSYYKCTYPSGKVALMASIKGGLCTPFTKAFANLEDKLKNAKSISEVDPNHPWSASQFWNMMSSPSSIYIDMDYSKEEVTHYLDSAGIKNGFFTVKIGDQSYESYRTKSSLLTVPKYQYDDAYEHLTKFSKVDYVSGSVFEIDGKEYTLSENGTLDVPYGVDIFDIKYPDRSFYNASMKRQLGME